MPSKEKARKSNDIGVWNEYKVARNDINNSIRAAKRSYHKDCLEESKSSNNPAKTWKIINEISGRAQAARSVTELKVADTKVNSATEISEVFNSHFTNIGIWPKFGRKYTRVFCIS